MKKLITYTDHVVEVKKRISGINSQTSFKRGERQVISNIIINPDKEINSIRIEFEGDKLLSKKNITNSNSWLKRHFKLLAIDGNTL